MSQDVVATLEPPYPPGTKAKGWRFELDIEQIESSDTWLRARRGHMKAMLLLLWARSWQQVPCGSLPCDDELIALLLDLDDEEFAGMKKILLRGWRKAADGRLYHPTITQRVLDMVAKKDAEKNRKAEWRRRKEAEAKLAEANGQDQMSHGTSPMSHGTNPMSHGTDGGQTGQSHGTDDTRTRTRTRTGLDSSNPPPREEGVDCLSHGTTAGQICRAMKQAGLGDVNPSNQRLRTLIAAGATEGEFVAAAQQAVNAQAGFPYALTIVANERKRAADLASSIHHGALPNKQEALEARNRAVASTWMPPEMRAAKARETFDEA